MDIDYQLTQDFLFLLELCKEPEAVFQGSTSEYQQARGWLDKLCRYECESLDERRLRNVYMSYLVACLNEGVLRGPFLTPPKQGKLQPADFKAESKYLVPMKCDPCTVDMARNGALRCRARTDCQAVSDKTKPKCKINTQLQCGYVTTQQVSPPDCMKEYTKLSPPGMEVTKSVDDKKNAKKSTMKMQQPICADCQEVNDNVAILLESIAAELRGESEPGSNDFLEHELARYKNFIMNYSSLACILQKLQSKPTLRSFLLLNLQNDLVKLLSENML